MSHLAGKPDTYSAPRLGRRAGALALAALGLAAAPLLWRALTRLAALLSYPYPQDGLEGTLLYEARLLWSGQPLYQPLERFRFVSAPYPPLHPVLLGLADQLAGPHVFWGGRLVSLAAALAVAALVLLIGRRAGVPWLAGAIGAALFLSAPPVLLWATRIKPDLLGLMFTALGLYLATRLTTDDRPPTADHQAPSFFVVGGRWSAVALCFALAFFTKQTAVAAPLATGLALLIGDVRGASGFRAPPGRPEYVGWLPLRWRTVAFGMIYAGLVLGGSLLLDGLTGGQYNAHVWGMHLSVPWTPALLQKYIALLAPYWPAILLAAALIAHALREGRGLVIACYALVVPISLVGAGDMGANHNHLLESLLAIGLATSWAAGWMVELLAGVAPARLGADDGRSRRAESQASSLKPALGLGIALLLAIQIARAYQPQQWYIGELAPSDAPARFLAFIRATPGEILADDVGLLVAAGRPLRYDDPIGMGLAARSGAWDQSGLIQEIAERRFSAILLPLNLEKERVDPAGRWTTELLAAIREHYRLAHRDVIFTYVPR